MFTSIAKKLFGTANERIVKGLQKQVEAVNEIEPEFQKLTDEQLQSKTEEFKARLEKGDSTQKD